jgi:tetratricopeptide (TPR) repeat protein
MSQRRSSRLPSPPPNPLAPARALTMKKPVIMLALFWCFLAFTPGRANEPYLEFIRALRAKNYPDLALEYMDRLNADKSVPLDIKAAFPLERARVRLDQASTSFNMSTRVALFAKARTEFEQYVKDKPNDPYAPEARFESARVLALQGRSQLFKAQRSEEAGAKTAEYQKAHDMFLQAGREMKAALGALDDQLAKQNPPLVAAALTNAKYSCQMEMSIAMMDRASTYEELNKNREDAGGLIKEAISELKKVHAQDPKNAVCWQAKAWAGKGFLDLDTPNEAKKEFDPVLTEPDSNFLEPAKRLVRFFMFMDRVTGPRGNPAEATKLGDEWFKLHNASLNTHEGVILRYELAKMYEAKGRSGLLKDPKAAPPPEAKAQLDSALALYNALDDIPSEFTDDVRNRKLGIVSILAGNIDVSKGLDNLKTFKDCYNTQQVLAAQLRDAEDKDRKKILETIVAVLERGAVLADDKSGPAEVAEVRANLAYCYMATGSPEKAVIIGEDVSRRWAHVNKAAAGAAYALQAYGVMLNEGAQMGFDAKWLKSDEERMMDLVKYMERTFPNDVTHTDGARHQIGTLLLRQKKPKEAADFLSRVSEGYKPDGARADARWWWSVAAQQALAEKDITDADKKRYQTMAMKALDNFPEVRSDAHGDIAQMYVQAQLQIAQMNYESKQYDKMEAIATKLQKRVPEFKNLDASFRTDLKKTVDALGYYANYGRALQELNAGRPAEARKHCDLTLQKVSAQVKDTRDEQKKIREAYDLAAAKAKDSKDDKVIAAADELRERVERINRNLARDSQLERGLLIVALRAAILDDQGARMKQLWENLQQIAAAGKSDKESEGNVSQSVYVQIVKEMDTQIKELKAGLPKTAEVYKKTVASFGAFLDKISAEVTSQKQPVPDMIFFLSNAYKSLDRFGDSGKLLAKIPDPGPKADDKAQNLFRAAQLLSLEMLRLGKQYDEAYKMYQQIRKTDWGNRSLQVDAEGAELFEDWGKFAAATKAYSDMIGKILQNPKAMENPRTKEQYYDSYFKYVFCLTKHAQTLTDAAKKQEFLVRAAKAMAKVENTQADFGKEGLKDKYLQLLKEEPALKKEYELAKAALKAAAAADPKQPAKKD